VNPPPYVGGYKAGGYKAGGYQVGGCWAWPAFFW
jgi:hypothetical protein